MTKYSKIKKSSFAILALSLILVAVLAFGGTYAYFSDKDTLGGSLTTATLTVTAGTDTAITFTDTSIVPGQIVSLNDKLANAKLEGSTVSALRIKISVNETNGIVAGTPGVSDTSNTANPMDESLLKVVVANKAVDGKTTWGWKEGNDGYYYFTATVSNLTITSAASISLVLDYTATNEWQGATVNFTVSIEAVQAEFTGGANTETQTWAEDQAISVAQASALFGSETTEKTA